MHECVCRHIALASVPECVCVYVFVFVLVCFPVCLCMQDKCVQTEHTGQSDLVILLHKGAVVMITERDLPVL